MKEGGGRKGDGAITEGNLFGEEASHASTAFFSARSNKKKSSFSSGASQPRGRAGLDKPRHGRNSNLTFSGPTSTWAVVDTVHPRAI